MKNTSKNKIDEILHCKICSDSLYCDPTWWDWLEMLTRSLHMNNWYLQSPHHTGHTQVTATADSAARHGRQTWLSPETTKATDWTVRTQDSLMINLCLSSRPATRHCQLAGVFIYHIWSELSNIAEKMSFLRPGNKWDKIKDLTGLNGLSNYSN